MVAMRVSKLSTVMLVDVLLRVTLVGTIAVALTVTVQFAVLLPSVVLTVIVALPADTPLTSPLDDTVAMAGALVLHDTLLFVALDGATVALSVSVLPTRSVVELLLRDTPVTATVGVLTVTVQVAVLLPSALVTVITALPADTAVTKPLWFTVATVALPLLHVTFLFVALDGEILAVKVSVFPTVREVDDLFKLTPVTPTVPPPLVTLTEQVAVLLPSKVVTVIVALPAETALTVPPDTLATALLLLLHDTFLLVALEGETVALRVSLPPTVSERLDLLRLTPVTVTVLLPPVTVTEQVAVLLPSVVVTVMVAFPAAIPTTSPFDDTEATAALLLLHNWTLLVASDGETVAINVSEPPTARDSVVLLKLTSVTAIAVVEMVTVALRLLLLSAVDVAFTTRLVAVSSSATVKSPFALIAVSYPPPNTDHVTVCAGLLLPMTSAPNCKALPFKTKALSGIIVTLLTEDSSSSNGCQKSRQLDNAVISMTDSKKTFTFLLFI
jgi:hypothetical protein